MSRPAVEQATKKTACILCSINCGLEVTVGGRDGREILKVKGDKDHVSSEGYLCNKAARLNHYQMSSDRLTSPLKRQPDGSFAKVSWSTAIAEVAARLVEVRDQHGGDKIYFIGGGGQGNHLGALYARGLLSALGVRYQTNALAQEKTGEFWVAAKMFGGAGPHGDFENAEVAVFVGKNPWQTHGFPQARKVLNDISKDDSRSVIVLDPALTDTARMADYHLRLKPGTDAWCLSAMISCIVQEGLIDQSFIDDHTDGYADLEDHFANLDITEHARICDVDESLIRAASRRLAKSQATSVFEDLGTQQNVHSTLVSYLQRIMWVITGNFAKPGTHNIVVPFQLVAGGGKRREPKRRPDQPDYSRSPVLGSRVIAGLLPCNEVPDEILTDHPNRFRAAIVQSSNPAHAYADTPRMRDAIEALEFSVVIDVAMTETARLADYVLPASSQFEKHECTFFSVEFPKNHFQLRHPIVEPLEGTLSEAEIHTRLIESIGVFDNQQVAPLKEAAEQSRAEFAAAFLTLTAKNRDLTGVAPSLLYRSLGPTLNNGGDAAAAPFWALCHQFAHKYPAYARSAGFEGTPIEVGENMFDTLCSSQSGFIYTVSEDYSDSWNRVGHPDHRIQLHLSELFPSVEDLDTRPLEHTEDYPFVLSAGNRRATTANTIIRDASWDKKGKSSTVYINPNDARQLGLDDGDLARITTKTGSGETIVETTDLQRPGTLSLPNGVGVDYQTHNGEIVRIGVAPNELTATDDRDAFAGTPWHKYVRARIEKAPT